MNAQTLEALKAYDDFSKPFRHRLDRQTCEACGTVYAPHRTAQRFCSRSCAWPRNMSACDVKGCGRQVRARGLCNNHYTRLMRHGDPLAGGTHKGDTVRFVAESILTSSTDECIIWPYAIIRGGYGSMTADGKRSNAHRYVCLKAHGEPPTPAHQAAHSCGRRACVNPRHLRWATRAENEADKIIHGTNKRGSRRATQ